MTEKARVIEIHGDSAKVECGDDASCGSCSSSFCSVKSRTFRATITPEVSVKIGDQVEVFVPPSKAIGAGFLVLIFPLLVFIGVYLAFGFLENEGAQVGAGLGGLIAGFGLVYLIGRGHRQDLPQIVRVFSAPDPGPGPDLVPVQIHGTTV